MLFKLILVGIIVYLILGRKTSLKDLKTSFKKSLDEFHSAKNEIEISSNNITDDPDLINQQEKNRHPSKKHS